MELNAFPTSTAAQPVLEVTAVDHPSFVAAIFSDARECLSVLIVEQGRCTNETDQTLSGRLLGHWWRRCFAGLCGGGDRSLRNRFLSLYPRRRHSLTVLPGDVGFELANYAEQPGRQFLNCLPFPSASKAALV